MLKVKNLYKSFGNRRFRQQILKDINLDLEKDNILGLIGGSGCGKTTLAMCICGLLHYNSGRIIINGKCIDNMKSHEKNIWLRKNVQYIFQNSIDTLHPKKKIRKIFIESVQSLEKLIGKRLIYNFEESLAKVNLTSSALNKYPEDFSGGERQRIIIARVLLSKPSILIADEPISNLDVTTQARILNLILELRNDGLSIIFITHDLAAAHYICDNFAFINEGTIIENGRAEDIIKNPKSNYAKKIIIESRV